MNRKYWDQMAPIYDAFMKKDRKAYRRIYELSKESIRGKKVLELATGTGLIARNTAEAAASMIATDYSPKMLEKAKRKPCPANLIYEFADACALKYADDTFDAVIISNALHIIPTPEKALEEIRRVLKPGGILIAPTFVHGKMKPLQRGLSKLMEKITGFHTEHAWTQEEYVRFLKNCGWTPIRTQIIEASFPLMYVECSADGQNASK